MSLFIELLQVAVGRVMDCRACLRQRSWLYKEAQRQAIDGLLLAGLESLPSEQCPSQMLLLQWIGSVQIIEQRNKLTTEVCKRTCERFENDGFGVCVLKGQANHMYYPEGMGNRRNCGDIDLWVSPQGGSRFKVQRVISRG